MSRRIPSPLPRLPIKWKLTLWSAFLLLLLFFSYYAVQHLFTEKWIVNEQKQEMRQTMSVILNYFLEREYTFAEPELAPAGNHLNRVNESNQWIRIVDENGRLLLDAGGGLPGDGIAPVYVTESEFALVRHERGSWLVMRSPITVFHFNGTVEIVRSMEQLDSLLAAMSTITLWFGLAAVAVSIGGGWLLSRQLLRPLKAMAHTIGSITTKGLQERMRPGNKHDELAVLMRMFNGMMDQVERSFRRQRQFVEDASHELRTPIAIIEGHLAMLRRWGKHDPHVLEESLDASLHELARLKKLTEELLALTAADNDPEDKQARLERPGDELRRIVKNAELAYPHIRFDASVVGLTEAVAVSGRHLEQLLLILIDNAVKHGGAGGVVRLEGSAERGEARISVSDRGGGIAAVDLPYVTDRFYRADRARSGGQDGQGGRGLGLAIAKRLVERYGGHMRINSEQQRGTTVIVSLPLAK